MCGSISAGPASAVRWLTGVASPDVLLQDRRARAGAGLAWCSIALAAWSP